MRSVLTADHDIPDRAPLSIRPSEKVHVGERDTQWPAFVFVTSSSGSGWVPARYIEVHGETGTVLTSYNTVELPAVEGETVEVLHDDVESGWSWCRNTDGQEGWIPNSVLRAV